MVKNGLATVHQQTGQGNLIVLDFDAKVHQRIRQGTQLLGGRLRCHHTLVLFRAVGLKHRVYDERLH